MLYTSVEQLVGNTPLLELRREPARILAKLECFNPGGSVKDRVAKAMIDRLPPHSTIVEPTSGNTGIGLALFAALQGHRAVIVMPDTMSAERIRLMEAYGGEVVLVPGGMEAAVDRAKALCEEIPGAVMAGQFENPANPQAHFDTTGPEIRRDLGCNPDIFVCGIGTGGTVTGVGRYLKACGEVQVVGVLPETHPHGIQGLGAGFTPAVLEESILDEILTVSDENALKMTRQLAKTEGLLLGISSGAAFCAALELANRPENRGKTIVTLFPDSGTRYLSVKGLF
jgi:cysteine synthase A